MKSKFEIILMLGADEIVKYKSFWKTVEKQAHACRVRGCVGLASIMKLCTCFKGTPDTAKKRDSGVPFALQNKFFGFLAALRK